MRLVYLGTPAFAECLRLKTVARAGHEIAAVYTQPDRARGRGQKDSMSAVKESALRLELTGVPTGARALRPEAP